MNMEPTWENLASSPAVEAEPAAPKSELEQINEMLSDLESKRLMSLGGHLLDADQKTKEELLARKAELE